MNVVIGFLIAINGLCNQFGGEFLQPGDKPEYGELRCQYEFHTCLAAKGQIACIMDFQKKVGPIN